MTTETSSARTIELGIHTWVASLVPTLAVYESGTPKGRSLAKQNLQRMAEVADLAYNAVRAIERMVVEGNAHGDDVNQVIADAKRLSKSKPADNTPEHHAAPSPAGDVTRACGVIAKAMTNLDLPLDVCLCTNGYYIGTFCDAQPYMRESEEYWPKRELAVQALRTGSWTQRAVPMSRAEDTRSNPAA